MPDIGATLREARMRARIDISEIESETKIRAKYLRALENEEWDLLPGPTYVKSFLRTYAEALGLDGKLLIEEYKLRHERLSDVELQPILPGGRERRRRSGPSLPRGWAVAVVVLALLGALYLLGRDGSEDPSDVAVTVPPPTQTQTPAAVDDGEQERERERAAARRRRERERRLARLQVVPTGPVYVCLKAAGARTLVNGVILQSGASTRTFRSRRFRLLLGNGEARLRVNGKTRRAPALGGGLEITRTRIRTLSGAQRPRCAA